MTQQVYTPNPNTFQTLDPDAVTLVGSAVTPIFQFNTAGIKKVFVQVVSSGTSAALTAFAIQAKASDASPFVTLYSSTADYTAPKGQLSAASGDLSLLGAGGSGWFILDVSPFASIQVSCTSASTPTLTFHVGGI